MSKLLLLSVLALFSSNAFAISDDFLKVVPGMIAGFDHKPNIVEKINQAMPVIEAIINSEEFRERVISYNGGGSSYASNNSLSNLQIYNLLMTGNEMLGGESSLGAMNFDIKRYKSKIPWSDVIAYTLPGEDNIIRANERKYIDLNVAGMAGNITHEWIHLMGFMHDSANDTQSVPYAIGDIMEELAEKYISQGELN